MRPTVLLLAVLAIAGCGHVAPDRLDRVVRITAAQVLPSDRDLPPADGDFRAPAQALPYFATRTAREVRWLWFRITVPPVGDRDEDRDAGARALYVPTHMADLTVFHAGRAIGGTRVPDGREAMGWNRPLLVGLPPDLGREGPVVLLLRLSPGVPTTALAALHVGPQALLGEVWRQKMLWQVDAAQVSLLLCVLMALFTAGLWWQRRQDRLYLLFALSALAWSVPMLYMVTPWAPVAHVAFLKLMLCSIIVAGVLLVPFLNRSLDFPQPRIERAIAAVIALGVPALVLAPANVTFRLALLLDVVCIAILLVAVVRHLLRAVRTRNRATTLVSTLLVVMTATLGHDIWVFASSYGRNEIVSSPTWLQFAFPLLLLVLFMHLIRRFTRALGEAETLNRELEQRVARVSRALELSWEQNRAHDLRDAATQEKQKIYRDLHDDVGAKLVSIIYGSDAGAQQDMARSALASLREAVAQANYRYDNLAALLAASIDEVRQSCALASLAFVEHAAGPVPEADIPPQTGYHLTRIIREAVTNVIKHAHASRVELHHATGAAVLRLRLVDDGRGLAGSGAGGNGMANIRYRAGEIGATVQWRNRPGGGCEFALELPLSG